MKSLQQCRVLVVDDMEENLWVAEDMLREMCHITTLQDGSKTLRTVTEVRPDLILLDVVMPGADGFSICKALKSDPMTSSIPVIFLTSLGDLENRIEGFEAGGLDYVTKPFFSREVQARVVLHLQNSLMAAELEERVRTLSQSLENTEENYLFLARTTADVFVQIGAAGQVSLINPAWTEITGVNVSQVVGRPFGELALPEDAAGLAAEIAAARTSCQRELRAKFRVAGKSAPVWLGATIRNHFAPDDAYLGSTAVLSDITALVEQAEGLLISKDGIEAAHVESIENLAHDLCTPLNAMGGGLRMLFENPEGIPHEPLEFLRQGYEEMAAIVTDLLGGGSGTKVFQGAPVQRLPTGFAGPVLLVDDSFVNLRLLQHLLKQMGFSQFEMASSGEEAVEFWSARQHPLVLMDLKMPGIGGFDACRQIREAPGGQVPAILAVSASAVPENAERCRECGFDGQLAKPVSLNSIQQALSALGR